MDINIAIIGTISSGKTTLLNSIFGKTLSGMNIRRTTMVPSKYNIIDDDIYEFNEKDMTDIYNQNIEYTNKFIDKVWTSNDDICEFNIKKPHKFINIYSNYKINIYDLPGLNDQTTKKEYYDYVNNNAMKWNIIYFMIDINSGFNTSDEMDILQLIIDMMNKNELIRVIIIMNKCDFMFKNDDGTYKLEEEQDTIYNEQIIKTIMTKCDDSNVSTSRFYYQPMTCKTSYIYRTIANIGCNKQFISIINSCKESFDELNDYNIINSKYIEELMVSEYGRKKWLMLPFDKKKSIFITYIQDIVDGDMMGHTGFCDLVDKSTYILNDSYLLNVFNKHIINNSTPIIRNSNEGSNEEKTKTLYKYKNEFSKLFTLLDYNKNVKFYKYMMETFMNMIAFGGDVLNRNKQVCNFYEKNSNGLKNKLFKEHHNILCIELIKNIEKSLQDAINYLYETPTFKIALFKEFDNKIKNIIQNIYLIHNTIGNKSPDLKSRVSPIEISILDIIEIAILIKLFMVYQYINHNKKKSSFTETQDKLNYIKKLMKTKSHFMEDNYEEEPVCIYESKNYEFIYNMSKEGNEKKEITIVLKTKHYKHLILNFDGFKEHHQDPIFNHTNDKDDIGIFTQGVYELLNIEKYDIPEYSSGCEIKLISDTIKDYYYNCVVDFNNNLHDILLRVYGVNNKIKNVINVENMKNILVFLQIQKNIIKSILNNNKQNSCCDYIYNSFKHCIKSITSFSFRHKITTHVGIHTLDVMNEDDLLWMDKKYKSENFIFIRLMMKKYNMKRCQ